MVVGASLERWKHGEVDLILVVVLLSFLALDRTLPEEDDAAPWASQTLVSCAGDHVTVLEWRLCFASGNQATDVSDVSHEQSTDLVCNGLESSVVPVSWVGAASANNHLWSKV